MRIRTSWLKCWNMLIVCMFAVSSNHSLHLHSLFHVLIHSLCTTLLFPLIRCHFYLTDTEQYKNRTIIYRQNIWKVIQQKTSNQWVNEKKMLTPLQKVAAHQQKTRLHRILGVAYYLIVDYGLSILDGLCVVFCCFLF